MQEPSKGEISGPRPAAEKTVVLGENLADKVAAVVDRNHDDRKPVPERERRALQRRREPWEAG